MLVHFDRSILNPLCCWCIHFFSFFFGVRVWSIVLSTFSWASYLWVCLCMADDIPSRSHMMMMMSRSDLQGRETNFTVHCSQCSWHMIASWWKRSIFSLYNDFSTGLLYVSIIYWAISSTTSMGNFNYYLCNWWDRITIMLHMQNTSQFSY